MDEELKYHTDTRLTNEIYINPIDQYILKYRDCTFFEKTFLRATENATCYDRLYVLNSIDDLIENPSQKITSFIQFYKKAKEAVESYKKPDLLKEEKV